MATGIDSTLKIFEALGGLGKDAVDIVKNGKNIFADLSLLVDITMKAKDIIENAPSALPELTDLNADEAAQLAAAAFSCVKMILDEIKR